MSEMTHRDQAVLIWPLLALAAQVQRVLTYGDIEGFTGIPRYGQNKALGTIFDYCMRKNYPPLNCLVVSADSGFPGDGFPAKQSELDHLVDRARVFAFNWSTKDKPRSEDFAAAQSATA